MKKLLLIISLVLMTLILSAQKKSNYEKYWQTKEDSLNKTIVTAKPEYDDLYYQPSKDAKKVKQHKRTNVDQIVDTLVKENPDIKVNYYYNEDPFFFSYNIGRFYHGGFNYWMYSNSWYYSNWMYDPYDWYWDMRFSGYPYWNYPYYNYGFGFGYNYWNPWRFNYGWGHNWYNHDNNWYSHNNWNNGGGNYHRPEYGHRETGSALSNHRIVTQPQQRIAPQNRATYSENRRTYSPSYNNPRMSTRPQYNNSRVGDVSNRRFEPSTQSRTQSRTQTSTFNRTPSTQSRTYSAPTRSYVESRNNNNSGTDRRSSGSYSSGSNYSSGSRSSGSSSYSSGSGSSGGRSSGGGGSSGRR